MSKTISLLEANQAFGRCIWEVEADAEHIISRNGQPVARLARIGGRCVLTARQEAGKPGLEGVLVRLHSDPLE